MKMLKTLLVTYLLLFNLSGEEEESMQEIPKKQTEPEHTIEQADPPVKGQWQLVWNDEFENPHINTKFWNLLDDAHGYGNRSQHYKPENLIVEDGILTLQSREEQSKGFPYTSGALTTKDKVSFLYGKVEVRAKLPSGKGLLPAIWFWNLAGNDFPEIDMVELDGSQPTQLWNVVHYEENGRHERDYTFTETEDLSLDFHVYSMEWHKDRIDFFVDSQKVFTATDHVPSEEMYLFVNAAIGGDWVGEPNETTTMPANMQIDWIRYYK